MLGSIQASKTRSAPAAKWWDTRTVAPSSLSSNFAKFAKFSEVDMRHHAPCPVLAIIRTRPCQPQRRQRSLLPVGK